MQQTTLPFVTIVVPVLNEERYIEACLTSLLAQGNDWADGSSYELLVMDGGSADRTRDIVAGMQSANTSIRWVDNPKRLQSAAMNLAARIASPRSTVLLRADAHAIYPPGFLAACVNELMQTGSSSVVVPMTTVGEAGFQRAVAATQNSLLGNGGSAHRRTGQSGPVDHGHHAAFDRNFFLTIGGYDETFSHNEDAEYDYRVRLAGGRVWMCSDAPVTYFPRRDPWGLARQYFSHGAGRARTLLSHHIRPRLRQLLPLVILAGCLGGLLLTAVDPRFAIVPLAYGLGCTAYAVGTSVRRRDSWLLAMGPAAMIMHLSWASGFIWKCLYIALQRTLRTGQQLAQLVSAQTSTGGHTGLR
jgi:succinoglycan biosynthesis protein ExoA